MTDMPSEAELQAREERVRANAERWGDSARRIREAAAAPSPASPEGPPHGGRICQCWCGPCCAGDHANCPADPAPRSPEGPDERLRERIAHAIRENTHIEDWYDALRCADAVLPLLTAERERADQNAAAVNDNARQIERLRDINSGLVRDHNALLVDGSRRAGERDAAVAERDALQRQVDAVRALCDESPKYVMARAFSPFLRRLRAALSDPEATP